MSVSFRSVRPGRKYSRNYLAKAWGYKSYHALARGIVTPLGDNKIIIFVTEDKEPSARQYVDRLEGDTLTAEGPDDHFAEGRIAAASVTGDEIHVFHRKYHRSDFTYLGKAKLVRLTRMSGSPSRFVYEISCESEHPS